LDQLLFWAATDLETKPVGFVGYYDKGKTPIESIESKRANLKSYRWRSHCRGLYQTPIAA
jgi:hypothetical protein